MKNIIRLAKENWRTSLMGLGLLFSAGALAINMILGNETPDPSKVAEMVIAGLAAIGLFAAKDAK